jgi:hypothetical protein
VEKPVFTQRIYSREGTYGLKMSIPFGTAVNLYGFADMYKMEKAGDMGGALKLEYLLGNTEMSLSCWGKKGYNPVGGYDFSTRILGWDILGEATLSHGSNMDRVRVVNGELETYRENGQWIAKACLDLGREFDGSDIPDRYSVKFEFFYNGAGYSHNVLSDTDRYIYNMQDPSNPAATIPVPATRAEYMQYENIYQMNYLSRYYAALFTTVNRLFISELAFSLNGVANLTDYSYIVSAGLTYKDINDFQASLTVNNYIGRENREYTFHKVASYVLCSAGIIF